MKTTTLSCKKINEDYVYADRNLWIVIDGATGLVNPDQMKTGSDAAWFSRKTGEGLKRVLDSDPWFPLDLALKKVTVPLIDQFPSSSPISAPSAAIAAAVKRPDGRIDWIAAGDCVLLFETLDGIVEIYDDRVSKLDEKSLAVLKKLAAANHTSLAEQLPAIKPMLTDHRKLRNKKGGYCALDLSLDWMPFVVKGSFPPDFVQSAALMSDGFYQYKQIAELNSEQFLAQIAADPWLPEKLAAILDEDILCIQYPRITARDDISLIYTDFQS